MIKLVVGNDDEHPQKSSLHRWPRLSCVCSAASVRVSPRQSASARVCLRLFASLRGDFTVPFRSLRIDEEDVIWYTVS